jgi:hypothetical protein
MIGKNNIKNEIKIIVYTNIVPVEMRGWGCSN